MHRLLSSYLPLIFFLQLSLKPAVFLDQGSTCSRASLLLSSLGLAAVCGEKNQPQTRARSW